MTAATDLDKVAADLFIWQAYDPAVKADLFSSAIVTAGGIVVVDPSLVGNAAVGQPYGFTFLPRKYCSDEKEMRRSLRKLLSYKTDRMLFAHGLPILSKASDRLHQLLDGDL